MADEWTFCASLTAARHFDPTSCYCETQSCTTECGSIARYSHVPERFFKPLASRMLEVAIGTSDQELIQARQKAIREEGPRKIP